MNQVTVGGVALASSEMQHTEGWYRHLNEQAFAYLKAEIHKHLPAVNVRQLPLRWASRTLQNGSVEVRVTTVVELPGEEGT